MTENHVQSAAAPLTAIIHAVGDDDLDAPTPCAEFDVRALMDHLLLWGPALEAAATKEQPPAPLTAPAADPTAGDRSGRLRAQCERLAEVWSAPVAWEGMTRMGGPTELPAELVGGMVAGELVVHGWDLAVAVGVRPGWDADVLEFVLTQTARSADLGRSMGIYGPAVPVLSSAATLDQILALTGRDPAWNRAAG